MVVPDHGGPKTACSTFWSSSGLLSMGTGALVLGFGVPIRETVFGTGLLVAGSVAITGGFVLVGLGGRDCGTPAHGQGAQGASSGCAASASPGRSQGGEKRPGPPRILMHPRPDAAAPPPADTEFGSRQPRRPSPRCKIRCASPCARNGCGAPWQKSRPPPTQPMAGPTRGRTRPIRPHLPHHRTLPRRKTVCRKHGRLRQAPPPRPTGSTRSGPRIVARPRMRRRKNARSRSYGRLIIFAHRIRDRHALRHRCRRRLRPSCTPHRRQTAHRTAPISRRWRSSNPA